MLNILLLATNLAYAQPADACGSADANTAFQAGYEAQQSLDTDTALEEYQRCLELAPDCVTCLYEIGWTYWSRSEWSDVVENWERVLEIEPGQAEVSNWLPQARENLTGRRSTARSSTSPTGLRVPIGLEASGNGLRMELVARFQNYDANPDHPQDNYDTFVYSPKSARFLADGSRVYVNSLEGYRTVIYDPIALERVGSIHHEFTEDDEDLFQDETTVFDYRYNRSSPSGNPNHFQGKPVESALSHDDRYLWVPYYRRDYDSGATSPSAVAVIDTRTDEIVRVLPTGPIPKYVAISPDDNWAAIAHWGDNTLGIIDISSGDPETFAYLPERLVVERVLPQAGLAGTNRDSSCGFCLRGTVFTPDSRTLLVSRMGGGGLAAFDVATWDYLGTLTGEPATPRHLVISPDGEWLYMSSNVSGNVSRAPLDEVLDALRAADGERVAYPDWETTYVGRGARTIEITRNGRVIFAAVNASAEVVALDAETMEILTRIRTDSYAVGLDVAPDGSQVWVTSQGRSGQGGNSVCVFSVEGPALGRAEEAE